MLPYFWTLRQFLCPSLCRFYSHGVERFTQKCCGPSKLIWLCKHVRNSCESKCSVFKRRVIILHFWLFGFFSVSVCFMHKEILPFFIYRENVLLFFFPSNILDKQNVPGSNPSWGTIHPIRSGSDPSFEESNFSLYHIFHFKQLILKNVFVHFHYSILSWLLNPSCTLKIVTVYIKHNVSVGIWNSLIFPKERLV